MQLLVRGPSAVALIGGPERMMDSWVARVGVLVIVLVVFGVGGYLAWASTGDQTEERPTLEAIEGPGNALDAITAADEGSANLPDGTTAPSPANGVGQPQTVAIVFESDDPDLAAELSGLDTSSLGLTSDGRLDQPSTLDGAVEAMGRYPSSAVTIVGHAFAESEAASHDRSHLLANLVAAHLEAAGVDGSRLSTVGMGAAPVARDDRPTLAVALDGVDGDTLFVSGSTEFTPAGLLVVDELSAILTEYPSEGVELAVYTYSEVDSDANHDLSHRQGDALANALAKAGVDQGRLVVVGRSDAAAFAQNGRANYVEVTPLD